jgi:hypothetical protein
MPRASISGSMPAQLQPDQGDYTACAARQCRVHLCATINSKGQTDLSAAQGNGGTPLCGCETIAWSSLRGLRRVSGQCLVAAACQNMKQIALLLARFCNPLRTLWLINMLWMLIGACSEKIRQAGNPLPEMPLPYSAS